MEGAWISVVEARGARLALDLVEEFEERWLRRMWWARCCWEARLANRRGQLPLQRGAGFHQPLAILFLTSLWRCVCCLP